MTRNVRRGTVRVVKAGGTARRKLREWVRRYLPCELAGTAGELGGASAGYYAAAYVSALRLSYRDHGDRRWPLRVLKSNLLALRSVAVEFGPAELIDSVAVRPVAFYVGPLIVDNTIGGWIFGKLVSDLAFYLIAIVCYERFKALLVRAGPSAEEVTDGSVPTVEAA